MTTKSQEARMKTHLEAGKSLTPLSALRLFGSLRLGARIFQLRKTMRIQSETVTERGKRFSKYYL